MREHHAKCPKSQAWDIEGVSCECPPGWPRRDVSATNKPAARAEVCGHCGEPRSSHRALSNRQTFLACPVGDGFYDPDPADPALPPTPPADAQDEAYWRGHEDGIRTIEEHQGYAREHPTPPASGLSLNMGDGWAHGTTGDDTPWQPPARQPGETEVLWEGEGGGVQWQLRPDGTMGYVHPDGEWIRWRAYSTFERVAFLAFSHFARLVAERDAEIERLKDEITALAALAERTKQVASRLADLLRTQPIATSAVRESIEEVIGNLTTKTTKEASNG